MGYPGCCVAAFQRQENRSNNTGNRYATAARTSDSPWCFELNNTALMLVPFFPCSYRCEPARAFARAVLREIGATLPDAAARIETELRRPVLYFEHGELVSFEGRMTAPGRIDYARVLVPEGASPPLRRLAAALGAGDALTLGDESLSVLSGTSTSFALRRLDPGLGFVAGWDGPQG